MINIVRVKNTDGIEFGFWLNICRELKCVNIGISFIKSLQFVIFWGE